MYRFRKRKQWRRKGQPTSKGYRSTGRKRRVLSKGGLRTHSTKLVRKRRGGLPHTRIKGTGNFDRPLQNAFSARRGRFILEMNVEALDSLTSSTTNTGLCRQQFICVNNCSPQAFTLGGSASTADNTNGLDVLGNGLQPQVTNHPPPGLLTEVFNRFLYAIVVGTEVTVTVQHTGSIVQANDGTFMFGLTPVTENELQQIYTGGFLAPGPVPGSRIKGAVAADQWNAICNMPGTVTKHMLPFGATQPSIVLHKKLSMDWFNTEPNWKAFVGNYCSNIVLPGGSALYYLPVNYRNYMIFSQYQSAGNSNSVGSTLFSVRLKQRWYVQCFEPIPAVNIA